MRALIRAAVAAAAMALTAPAIAAGTVKPPSLEWSFNGVFGTFDRGALRRGYQVYAEVCAGCHSVRLLYFRDLGQIGFGVDEVKKIAAEFEVHDGPNEDGEMFDRPARPEDRFQAPFANPQAARAANNGALPPDLSLITKARTDGVNYLHALLSGYRDEAPAGVEIAEGRAYNAFFPGGQIAMAPPLSDEAVEYPDGTKATVDRMARDVVTFLAWAAEPKLEERKSMGIKVVLFLIVLTGMVYAIKRKVWADIEH